MFYQVNEIDFVIADIFNSDFLFISSIILKGLKYFLEDHLFVYMKAMRSFISSLHQKVVYEYVTYVVFKTICHSNV